MSPTSNGLTNSSRSPSSSLVDDCGARRSRQPGGRHAPIRSRRSGIGSDSGGRRITGCWRAIHSRYSVMAFGGSFHLHAPVRPARSLNRAGSLKGTSATIVKGTVLPLTGTAAYSHRRTAVSAASSRRLHCDQSMRACPTLPEGVTFNSRSTTPSSPASSDALGYTGRTSLIFRGAATCPTTIAESTDAMIVVTDVLRIARGRCVTGSLDTYPGTKFLRPTLDESPSAMRAQRAGRSATG
jgi:hypothetical protein